MTTSYVGGYTANLGGGGGAGTSTIYNTLQSDFRLSLATANPLPITDLTSVGLIYFTPVAAVYNASATGKISIWTGSASQVLTSAEISLVVSLTSGKVYDVFAYSNAGTLTLELSAAWTNTTTRADALGTATDGTIVKNSDKTRRWVGTLYASGTDTVVDSAQFRHLYNAYNQFSRTLVMPDDATSFNYSTNTIQQYRATTGNQVEVVFGSAYSKVELFAYTLSTATSVAGNQCGIGVDATNAISSKYGRCDVTVANVSSPQFAQLESTPGIGRHFFPLLQYPQSASTYSWVLGQLQGNVTM
jgi:hypothetical protein